jgi:hypothetical protein
MDNESILREAGFVELPERMIWISRDRRISFSHQAIRDHDSHWLRDHLAERVPTTDFVFHFNSPPENVHVCNEILAQIGLPALRAHVRVATFRSP